MPAWPSGVTYTKGMLGSDQRATVTDTVAQAAAGREAGTAEIASRDYAAIRADEPLMGIVRETGRALFGDNCMACHGANATGGPGYPNLTDGAWLWGGDPETIAETIRVGINSGSAETRISQMMRSEEHTSELQSLMRISYAVFCL